ncbi:class I SAM-dependent methyltransferase [Alcaligenes sp. GCM10023179]|uniref:class I SAM-dependent methyltransferase n=1 Tax=Alcaligenes sp. GCM10023179 TaxID=3252633 RepID=UPI0036164E52
MKTPTSVQPFSDPALVARYADTTPQRIPGFHDLHRMALILLSERVTSNARILVLAAGGGLELKSFVQARPDWSFVGVDPSQAMLDLAAQVLGPLGSQVDLIPGYVDDAPLELFDGATCLLTLHFLSKAERLSLLKSLLARLKPGAALVVAHHCRPEEGATEDWLARSIAFATGTETTVEAIGSASNMARHLTLLSPQEEEGLLREAGFTAPALFYAGLSFRGWVAYADDQA